MPKREKPDGFVESMQALAVDRLPEGPDCIFECKLDGYRAQAVSSGVDAQTLSRNGLDLGHRFPHSALPWLMRFRPNPSSTASSWR